jgi:hypothetical protein
VVAVVFRFLADPLEFFLELFQVLIGKFLKIDKFISRVSKSADNLIELQMDRLGVAILSVLDEENHQECDDGCAGVDNKLPCVREMKGGARDRPYHDDEEGDDKSPSAAENLGRSTREDAKGVRHDAEEIPLYLVFSQLCDLSLLHGLTLTSRAALQMRAWGYRCYIEAALYESNDVFEFGRCLVR